MMVHLVTKHDEHGADDPVQVFSHLIRTCPRDASGMKVSKMGIHVLIEHMHPVVSALAVHHLSI